MSATREKKPSIELKHCHSSNIIGYGYDAKSNTLAIKFKGSGQTYHYDNVPQDVFNTLGKADSVGKFFLANIKNKFKHTRLD